LNFLRDFVMFPFADEEKALQRNGYPERIGHAFQHQEFKEWREGLREKLLRGDRAIIVGAPTKA
jgi:hypothetical protein